MELILFLVVIIYSVVLHEISHGAVALALGDNTAKQAGRLTLNPIPHIDPIGSVLLPALFILLPVGGFIAWAKPVPVNDLNLRDRKFGSLKVSAAGPIANLAVALFFGIILRLLLTSETAPSLIPIFRDIIFLNLFLAFFNLVPVPPLDGSHVLFAFLSEKYDHIKRLLMQYGFFILIGLIFLLPSVFFPIIAIPVNAFFSTVVGQPAHVIPSFFF